MLAKIDSIKVRLSAVTALEGVTPQQYNILRILRGAGADGLPTLEISKRMLEQSPGITRLIDRLERKRLVKRIRSSVDRRLVNCCITGAGLEILDKLEMPIREYHSEVSNNLNESEKKLLIDLLHKICI